MTERRPPAGPPEPPPAEPEPGHTVLTESAGGAPAPPRRPFAGAPGHASAAPRGTDPQAGVDTTEIPLAELQAAARRAQAAAAAGVEPPDVDLVEAEDREAQGHDGAAAEPDPGASEGTAAPEGDASPGWDAAVLPGRSPIDPRIRERRVAVTRAEGRRRLRMLLCAVSIASAIGIAWLVAQSPLLAVDTINVRGTTTESQAAVRFASGVKTGSALLFVDTGAVARRVEALPWVAAAKVARELPNDLTITVEERVPVAWVRRPVPRGHAARDARRHRGRRPLRPGARATRRRLPPACPRSRAGARARPRGPHLACRRRGRARPAARRAAGPDASLTCTTARRC